MNDEFLRNLFQGFSAPLAAFASTSRERRELAEMLARNLWAAMIAGPEMESKTWKILKSTGKLDDSSLEIIKQLYFQQMKAVITEEQLADLRQRYDAGYQELVRVLEDAVGAGVTNLSFEYKGRELIVFHQVASVGLGANRIVENLQNSVIKELIKRARLAKRTKGKMKITLLRRDFEVLVEEYDSFGESAFNLTIRERK